MKKHLMKGVPIGGVLYENAMKIHQAAAMLLYWLLKLLRANKKKKHSLVFTSRPVKLIQSSISVSWAVQSHKQVYLK